jgi:hypothetical protein
MCRIIQTVHHDNGNKPMRYWYTSMPTIEEATATVDRLNARNKFAIDDPNLILVTYHTED